jgi:hypothetical protein
MRIPWIVSTLLLVPAITTPASAQLQGAATDLAIGYCLHAEGLASRQQSYAFVASRGQSQGRPAGWFQAVDPRQIQGVISQAGGCGTLLRMAQGAPTVVPPQSRLVPINQPQGYPRSRSESEGFGLSPYR